MPETDSRRKGNDMTDIIRVLRILEYIGPRDAIEKVLSQNAVKGFQVFGDIGIRESVVTPGNVEVVKPPIFNFEYMTKEDYEAIYGWGGQGA